MELFKRHAEEKLIRYLESCDTRRISEILRIIEDEGNSWLHFYSGKEYSNLQDIILEAFPATVHAENVNMETPIFYAIRDNNLELVKKIVAVDESVLTHMDINGRTPLFLSFMSKWCSVKICEFLWGLAPPLQGDFLWHYINAIETSFEKSIFIINNTPGVFDMTFDKGENVLHKTIYVRSIHTKRLIKYIYEKSGTALFSATDSLGMNALHHSYADLLKLIYDLYPDAVYQKDMFGNIPLAYSQNNGNILNPVAVEIMKKYPELLEIQNNKFQTIFMQNRLCPRVMFRINPASFTIRDEHGNNALHHICSQKNADWWKLVDEVLKVYPTLLFQKNNEKKNSLDIGISKSGYSSQQRSRERFVAVCLKYSELPDKYWIFDKISFDLVRSTGHILDRSRDEVANAMTFLPSKDKKVIQNLIIGMNHLEPEMMTDVIKRMFN